MRRIRGEELPSMVLMNDTLPASDDVAEWYIRPSVEHLRSAVEPDSTFPLGRLCLAA